MEENFRIHSSVLADLGPLPEVVESNSDTVWQAFLQLDAQHAAPSCEAPRWSGSAQPRGEAGIAAVMAQARRFNRVCPVEAEWLRLHAVLAGCGAAAAPEAVQGAAFRKMPALAKRAALRDLVEWAADHGCLASVDAFLAALPEERWIHMGD